MKSERVTDAWEFYRDNCQGFKEPMRKEFRKLDKYVANLEAENAKLRELLAYIWTHKEALPYGLHLEVRDKLRELGMEVDE